MKITLISLIFPPESGSARRVGELARFLSRQGHQVTVITGFPSYPTGIVYKGYRKRLFSKERWLDDVNILRVYLYTSPLRQVFLKRLLHYFTFMLTALLGGFLTPRPDIVYVVSPPYFLGFSGWFVARFRCAKMVFDVQDFWPEAPIALGYVKGQWLISVLLYLEKFIYHHSDMILALSLLMRQKIIERGAAPDKVKHVYNWVDLEIYKPQTQETNKVLGLLPSGFVILFAGNLGMAQGLDSVIDSAILLKGHTDITFVLLGGGVERERLQQRAQVERLSNVYFIDPIPEKRVLAYFAEADVLLVTLGKAAHREAAIPSKIQVYMASGKPILAGLSGAAAEVLRQAQCGLVVEPDAPQQLAEAVIKLRDMPFAVRESLGYAGMTYAQKHFSLEKQCGYIESQLAQIVR